MMEKDRRRTEVLRSFLGRRTSAIRFFVFVHFAVCLFAAAEAQDSQLHLITVVDQESGRGVPMVELTTTNELRFVTDNAGRVAIDDGDLLGQKVFFHVFSHGYEFAADGFGFRGKSLELVPGGTSILKLKRLNIAERLYRVTGSGLYRDTVRAGLPTPLRAPLLNAQVTGQDSVQMTTYKNRLYWFWGDTNRLSYPLGHFGTAGATAELPQSGGLDPAIGVDLTYFVGTDGFSRKMIAGDEPGMKWLDGLCSFTESDGREILAGRASRMKSLTEVYDRRLVLFNDETKQLETQVVFDPELPLMPVGAACLEKKEGESWIYFGDPFPVIRVRASLSHLRDQRTYEAFTCLELGARYEKKNSRIERRDGRAVWGWKVNTGAIHVREQQELVNAGRLEPRDALLTIKDEESGKPIQPHGGDVHFNNFRKKWVMIFLQAHGKSSYLGEVWYTETDNPWTGPWSPGRKIVTHQKYSFYNVRHHAPFDQQEGRFIFFEGTYTNTFSGNVVKTPRYDYNQIMYRLDLSNPRLKLSL